MNIVAIIGNLAADPELRQTTAGKAVCEFRVAVSRQGKDEADFFTVVAFEKQAEVCAEYLSKGRRVSVEGRLFHSTWETTEGLKRSKVEIIATRVGFLGKRPDSETDTNTDTEGVFA